MPAINPAEVVETFITLLNQGPIGQGMDPLAEDVFHHTIPMDPTTSREAVRAFAQEFGHRLAALAPQADTDEASGA